MLVAKIGALVESAEARDIASLPTAEEQQPAAEALAVAAPTAVADNDSSVEVSADPESSAEPAAVAAPAPEMETLEFAIQIPTQLSPLEQAIAVERPAADASADSGEFLLSLEAQPVAAPPEAVLPKAEEEHASLATTAKIFMRMSPDASAAPTPAAQSQSQWPIAPAAAKKSHPARTPAPPIPASAPETRAAQPERRAAAEIPSPDETPAFDSTQTIRALTPLELQNGQASKSYSIQLLLSKEPIHPEQIPNLDIFEAYRLYVVTGLVEEGVMHALRLGFFTSEVAAEAVAGYLTGYFDKPTIKRVSLAEHDRFQERRVAARKDVGATGKHSTIELASRPALPERRAVKLPEAAPENQRKGASIWSRLVSPLKR